MDYVISETKGFDHGSSRFGPTKTRGFHLSQCGGAWFLLCHALEAQRFAAHAKTNWVIVFFLIIPKIMWKWNSPFPKEHSPDSRKTRWWFQRFLIFKPTWGNNPIWRAYFSNGWLNHQLEKHWGHVFVFLHVCCMDVGNLNHWVKILQLHSMGLFSSQALRKLEEIDWDMPQMSKGQQYLERH